MDSFSTQSKKLKTYIKQFSKLILKRKMRLHQLTKIDSAETVVFLLMLKLPYYEQQMNTGKEIAVIFWGEKLIIYTLKASNFSL